MSDDVLIKVENVSKKFCRRLRKSLWYGLKDMAAEATGGSRSHDELRPDEFWAVKDVSFELRRGECIGLIGHNGAGKTTLLKILNGLIKPDHGSITMRGRVGALIALGAGFNPILTGRENIYVNASVLGLTRDEIESQIPDILDFAGIGEFLDAPVQSYSSGMQVRLGFAVASSIKPQILILDEVLAVGDMAFQAKCFNRLSKMRKEGTAFILVSHNMHHISRFCTRALHLANGRVRLSGATSEAVESFTTEQQSQSPNHEADLSTNEGVGTMTTRITDAYFTNVEGLRTDCVRYSEPVVLVIEYKRTLMQIKSSPSLEIAMRLMSGDLFFQTVIPEPHLPLPSLESAGAIRIAFNGIPANNTTLSLSIVLWDKATQEVIHWLRGVRIMIKGDPGANGLVAMKYKTYHS